MNCLLHIGLLADKSTRKSEDCPGYSVKPASFQINCTWIHPKDWKKRARTRKYFVYFQIKNHKGIKYILCYYKKATGSPKVATVPNSTPTNSNQEKQTKSIQKFIALSNISQAISLHNERDIPQNPNGLAGSGHSSSRWMVKYWTVVIQKNQLRKNGNIVDFQKQVLICS